MESKAIADKLASEGERGTSKDLATSVGNTLTRAGWTRTDTGRYAKKAEVMFETT